MKFRAFGFVLTLVVLAFALAPAAPVGAQAAPAGQKPLKIQKLSDSVWAAEPGKGANVGWFLLGDGVVAVDSGSDSATGKEILKAIGQTTGNKPVRILVLTHSHGDHSGGARAFVAAGARILCQESVAGQVLAYVSQPAQDPNDPLAGKPNVRPVIESISERSIMVDGLHNAQIYFLGAAHTSGDLAIYLPTDKILFSGDLALNKLQPSMQSAEVDPAGWERILQTLAKVPVEKLVPGHGEIGPTEGLADSLAYVTRVDALAKKFVESGAPDDQLDAQIRAPENAIPNVPLTDAHVANVKASVKAIREKASRKTTTPSAAPATPRAPLPAATTPAK